MPLPREGPLRGRDPGPVLNRKRTSEVISSYCDPRPGLNFIHIDYFTTRDLPTVHPQSRWSCRGATFFTDKTTDMPSSCWTLYPPHSHGAADSRLGPGPAFCHVPRLFQEDASISSSIYLRLNVEAQRKAQREIKGSEYRLTKAALLPR